MATYTLSMKNSWTSGQMVVSHTLSSNKRSATVTVKLVLWRNDGGRSHNDNASKNFYVKNGSSTKYFTNTSISGSKETHSYSRTYTLNADGTLSVAVKVGGGLSSTTFKITGNNSKTYKITGGAKKTYKITYNANGGEDAPAAQTKTHGVALTLKSTKPTREETSKYKYTFKNWLAKRTDGTSYTYASGATMTYNCEATMYAQWNAIQKYTITYKANGGSGAPGVTTKYHGTNVKLSSTKPTRSGYIFKGWALTDTATTIKYGAGATYSVEASDILYAVWEQTEVPVYTILFEEGTDDKVTNMPDSVTKKKGTDLQISSAIPVRGDGLHWQFYRWSTTRSDGTYYLNPGGKTTYEGDQTLVAQWTRIGYDIIFDPNDGTGGPGTVVKTKGTALTIPSTNPKRTNYTFKGWSTSASAISATYSAGNSFTTDADTTLYAVWEEYSHTVTFNKNGGTGNVPASFTKTTANEVYIEASGETEDTDVMPTKAGYAFIGWNTKSDGSGTMFQPGEEYTLVQTANVTLYAQWASTDIYIYKAGNLKAVEFIEGDRLMFTPDGAVIMPEFVEGAVTTIAPTKCTIAGELIQQDK
jgi:uncharacterized repeat protein (TIGR02543 family)